MSYYSVYYHPPSATATPASASISLVHNTTPTSPTPQSLHPGVKSTSAEPGLSPATPATSRGLGAHGKREPISTGLSTKLPMNKLVHPQSQSPFCRLPAELRNHIYSYLLCPSAIPSSKLAQKTKDLSVRGYNETFTTVTLYPQILSTCRGINTEAKGLLYTTNVFHAHASLLTSLPHLTSAARPVLYPTVTSLIRRWQICLRLDTDPRFTAQQAKVAFSGAEYLEIRVWQAQFEACDWGVLKLFLGVRDVQVARVGGSVDKGLAEWLEGVMMTEEEPKLARKNCGCGDEEEGEELGAVDEKFKGRTELVCGRCYGKVDVLEWVGQEWNIWRLGGV